MRLFEGATLMTNPRRVTIYLAEKGILCERVKLDMRAGAGRTPEFLRMNPAGTVPVLELDDGTFLPESGAIIEYFEELHPRPTMLGSTPQERAQVRATERMACDFLARQGTILANTHPNLPKWRPGFKQYPQAATAALASREQLLQALEHRIGEHEFLAADRPTIADCTLFAVLNVSCNLFDYEIPPEHARLRHWYDRFNQRPSARYP